MTRTLLLTLSVLGSAVFQTAQSAQAPPPDIDLGDARGANFDAQAIGTATPADFDFLIGTWSFEFQQQAEPGKYRPTQTGAWTVQKTHDAHIVEDVWRLGTTTNPTITYRVFNPSRKLWEIQGTKPERGGWDDGIAWSQGNARFLVQHFNSSALLVRIKYFDITGTSFGWRADGSSDQGKTWTPDIWKMRATRTSAAARSANLMSQ